MNRKSKVMTIQLSMDDETDVFHYRVCEYKGHKCLIGWEDGEEDNAGDITDLHDLALWQFDLLYRNLAMHGHLLNLEWTVEKQTPMFTDNDWRMARFLNKMEKE